MKIMQTTTLLMMASLSMGTWAAEFSFDRPGSGFGTGITPVGHVAWEQGLPSATYDEQYVDGLKVRTLNLSGNMLLRSGLNEDTELQLGWQGLSWTKTKSAGQTRETDGLGDVSIGVKKAINLKDEQLTMAVLAQVQLATGNPGFSAEDDIYSLSSALAYRYSDLITTAMTMRYEMQDREWAVTAVPSIQYKIAGNWSGFSEFVYRKAESQPNETSLASGVMYALNDRAQLDASVGVSLSGERPDYHGGLGVSFLF